MAQEHQFHNSKHSINIEGKIDTLFNPKLEAQNTVYNLLHEIRSLRKVI